MVGASILCASGSQGQSQQIPPELQDNPAAGMMLPYATFIGAKDCVEHGWHFSSADLEIIQRKLDQDGANFAKQDKDEVWQYMLSSLAGGKTGVVEEQCKELRSVMKDQLGYAL